MGSTPVRWPAARSAAKLTDVTARSASGYTSERSPVRRHVLIPHSLGHTTDRRERPRVRAAADAALDHESVRVRARVRALAAMDVHHVHVPAWRRLAHPVQHDHARLLRSARRGPTGSEAIPLALLHR